MSNTPPKVAEFFIAFAAAAAPILIFFVVFKSAADAHDVLCIGTIIFPILFIFLIVRSYMKYRENKPAEESVQKLGLDE